MLMIVDFLQKYQPHATDPNRSGALASVLWELNLLMKHYHPAVSSIASSISTMNTSNNQVYHSHVSPEQAYMELSQENKSVTPPGDIKRASNKRKRGNDYMPVKVGSDLNLMDESDENEVRKKLAEHFLLLRDIQENEKLRSELDRTTLALNLYEHYKKQKKRKTG